MKFKHDIVGAFIPATKYIIAVEKLKRQTASKCETALLNGMKAINKILKENRFMF